VISSKHNVIASSPNAPSCGQPNNVSKLFRILSSKNTTKRKEMICNRGKINEANSHPLEYVIPNLINHMTLEKNMLNIFLFNGTKHTTPFKIASNDTFIKQSFFGWQFIKHQPPPKNTTFRRDISTPKLLQNQRRVGINSIPLS
jgi:hypothetical protein